VRRTLGGPAPEETERAAAASHRQLAADEAWCAATTEALGSAERALEAQSRRL